MDMLKTISNKKNATHRNKEKTHEMLCVVCPNVRMRIIWNKNEKLKHMGLQKIFLCQCVRVCVCVCGWVGVNTFPITHNANRTGHATARTDEEYSSESGCFADAAPVNLAMLQQKPSPKVSVL